MSMDTTAATPAATTTTGWGNWMGAWKVGADVDEEAERIDRQKAAFGGDTVARIKDLNVLILGCRGVGVETAKNLILSNVGSVMLWDDGNDEKGKAARMPDMGTNFYLTASDVTSGKGRVESSLPELKTLNPFCKVEGCPSQVLSDDIVLQRDVLGTGRPFSAIVVTDLLPRADLERLNALARKANMAFILAINKGVTISIFSDFGQAHEITDATGEPTQMLAISNLEIVESKPELLRIDGVKEGETVILVTVAQAEHKLDDGDIVVIDDMRNNMAVLNGRRFEVRRVAFQSPTDAKVDARDVAFKEALKQPTVAVLENFQKQYQFYKSKFDQEMEEQKKTKTFPIRTITMFNRLALVLTDNDANDGITHAAFTSYEAGGLLNQVHKPVVRTYSSFTDTLERTAVPQMLRGEDWEGGKGIEPHVSISAALDFHDLHGRWPIIHNMKDANQFLDIAKGISMKRKEQQETCWSQKVSYGFPSGEERDLDEDRLKCYARLFGTELTGFCAFLGGAAAQEVLKKTGKFTPIDQWIHHDESALFADDATSNVMPLFGSRYDHQIAILGKDFQAKASNQRVFLVGCGALGCEYLKGLSLMGVGTGRDGMIYVTDMDTIEVSNLSRQFLFRDADVGHPKSVSGARVVKGWNPQMNIQALEKKVGPDSEDFFNDKFWESLDVCWNALDNVLARKYTDAQCLFYSKPLLESGTLGTKCNHEIVLPFRTSSYNDGKESDENENQIAMCTLRSFPYLPLHCIEFAKQAYFSDYFEFGPDQYETFRKDMASFFEQLDSMEPGEQLKSLRMIEFFIQLQEDGKTITFDQCLQIAFDRMVEDFRTSILNLCSASDKMEETTGKKFWTGTKRRPNAVNWTKGDNDGNVDGMKEQPSLIEYLYCTANMYAVVWGLEPIRNRASFEDAVNSLGLKQPEWSPSDDKVDLNEGEDAGGENGGSSDAPEEVEKLKAKLYSVDVASLQAANAHDFEKDDDSNFHIDFLTVATNLRSWNYDIKASQRHTVKVTAGRIIPALATTTAMVCGLVDIEFCKLVLGLQCMGRDKFLNSNINLALGSSNFTTYSPDPPLSIETGLDTPHPASFTSWDKIEIDSSAGSTGELSVEQLVGYIERNFGVTVDRIFASGSTGDKALYNAVDKQKLNWDITNGDDGKPKVSDGVFVQWPQIKMAVQMLSRLPPTSGQRKIFEKQVDNVKKSLEKTKANFVNSFQGPVSAAYRSTYRPQEDKETEQEYFDTLFAARNYLKISVHCHKEDGKDIHLPSIKCMFQK